MSFVGIVFVCRFWSISDFLAPISLFLLLINSSVPSALSQAIARGVGFFIFSAAAFPAPTYSSNTFVSTSFNIFFL